MSEEFNSPEFVDQRTDRSSASGWQYANRPALVTAAAVAQVASIYAILLDIPETIAATIFLSPVIGIVTYAVYLILTPAALLVDLRKAGSVLFLPRAYVWFTVLVISIIAIPGILHMADPLALVVICVMVGALGGSEITLRFRARFLSSR